MVDLFDYRAKISKKSYAPLADRIRPQSLEEFVGQEHILGPGKPLRQAIENDQVPSLIIWGPPGTGKTTLAHILAQTTGCLFTPFSAVTSGIKEIKKVMVEAEDQLKYYGKKTMLFVDEIHRFNKAQQDAFLPYVEKGTLILVGATTENPSFEVIGPLLSRVQVFVLDRLADEQILTIVQRALKDKDRGLGAYDIEVEEEALARIVRTADGDARQALNLLELAFLSGDRKAGRLRLTAELAQQVCRKKVLLYDKQGEEHYNLISALHKSLRGSDPDASLYWLTRMLAAGEDPLYIARRMVRFASEDIGNAEPLALLVALAAKEAYHFLGSPEGELALAQCAIFMASCPKSNAVYKAYQEASQDVEQARAEPVPSKLRNPVTELMAKLGYGKEYKYPHDFPDHYLAEDYLPKNLIGRRYYRPTGQGKEADIRRRLEQLKNKGPKKS